MTSVFPLWQWNALQDFFTATNGQHWVVPNGEVAWNFTSPEVNNPCTDFWYGLKCDNGYEVSSLSLSASNLTGYVPYSIGMLSTLDFFDVTTNHLTGTFPDSISNCTGLSELLIASNRFRGSIPASIGNLTSMFELIIADNQFSGSVPETLGNIRPFYVDFSKNRLIGTFPTLFCQYSYVFILDLHLNFFTGVLPDCLYQLQGLNLFDVHGNLLYGELPDLTSWQQISTLDLSDNAFSGTLDHAPGNNSSIRKFYVDYNEFHGSLPIRTWSSLGNYFVYLNYLTGGLPCSLSSAKYRLEVLEVASNYLHGGIPSCLEGMPHLYGVYMADNMFSGSLNSFDFSTWAVAEALYIDDNFFHGKLPSSIGKMISLLGFTASYNSLTGTFPESFQNLKELFQLYLEGNSLSGNLNQALNWTNLEHLVAVDLSNNQFTGPVPRDIFSAPLIESVALASNCFTGSIPDSICKSSSLSAVSLDGLSTALNCRIPLFPGISGFDAFIATSSIGGTIPRCLFEMSLSILHLSGNELTGSLPADIVLPPELEVLSLSHNRLTGTLPANFMNRYWNNLDLSYNKFVGNLDAIQVNTYSWENASVSLEVNRLSGNIPGVLTMATNISMLDGNMFSCDLTRSQLPVDDSESDIYVCASDDVDDAFYFWVAAWLVPMLVVLLVERKVIRKASMKSIDSRDLYITVEDADERLPLLNRRSSLQSTYNPEGDSGRHSLSLDFLIGSGVLVDPFESVDLTSVKSHSTDSTTSTNFLWWSLMSSRKWFRWQTVFEDLPVVKAGDASIGKEVLLFYRTMVATRRTVCWITAFILVVLFPTFSVLTTRYGTYSQQYAWQVSAAFLSGMSPSLVLFFFLAIFQLFGMYHIVHSVMWGRDEDSPSTTTTSSSEMSEKTSPQFNSTYEYLVSEPYLYVSWSIALVLNLSVMLCLDSVYVYIALTYSGTITTITQLFLAFAKLVWNENLLFFLLYHSRYWTKHGWERWTGRQTEHAEDLSVRDITVLSMISIVNKIVVPCIAIAVVNSNCFYNALYSAPPVTASFIYCDTKIPFNPCTNLLASGQNGETYSPPFLYGFQCSSFFLKDYVPVFVYMFAFSSIFVPFVLFCLQNLHDSLAHEILFSQYAQMQGLSRESSSTLGRILHGARFRSLYLLLCEWLPQTWQCPHAVSKSKDDNKSKWIMIVNTKQRTVIRINNHLAILVSFAALFPPLAFIALVSICILTYFEERNTARLIKHALLYKKHWLIQRLDRECRGVANSFRYTSVWMLFLGSWLFAFFVFDTFGDEKGFRLAIGPAVTMCCIPLLIVSIRMISTRLRRAVESPQEAAAAVVKEEDGESEATPNVEMQSFSDTSSVRGSENPIHTKSEEFSKVGTLKDWREAV